MLYILYKHGPIDFHYILMHLQYIFLKNNAAV